MHFNKLSFSVSESVYLNFPESVLNLSVVNRSDFYWHIWHILLTQFDLDTFQCRKKKKRVLILIPDFSKSVPDVTPRTSAQNFVPLVVNKKEDGKRKVFIIMFFFFLFFILIEIHTLLTIVALLTILTLINYDLHF